MTLQSQKKLLYLIVWMNTLTLREKTRKDNHGFHITHIIKEAS